METFRNLGLCDKYVCDKIEEHKNRLKRLIAKNIKKYCRANDNVEDMINIANEHIEYENNFIPINGMIYEDSIKRKLYYRYKILIKKGQIKYNILKFVAIPENTIFVY